MTRIALLPSAFLIITIFFSFVSTTPIPTIHEATRILARQGAMGEFEPIPSSAATPIPTPTPTPSSSTSTTTPLWLSAACIAGGIVFLFLVKLLARHTAIGRWFTECFGSSPRSSPTPSEKMSIWAEHSKGKRLHWGERHGRKRLVSLHYDGDPRTVLPGMWIGRPKGTTREMTSLFNQFSELPTYITSYNTAGGGQVRFERRMAFWWVFLWSSCFY
jgi:hypothetical protein